MKKLLLLAVLTIISLMKLSSQCNIRDITLEIADCNGDDVVAVLLQFNADEVSDTFTVVGNGINYGTFAYADLPINLGNFEANCDTQYEFIIKDKANPECSGVLEYGKICCEEECNIEIVDFEAGRCDEEGVTVSFDIEKTGTAGLGFDVFAGDDFVGFYKYDELPIRINNFPSTGTATEKITVCENDRPDCCDTLVFESTCGCGIFDIDVDIIECDDEAMSFYAKIDFDPQMTSDSFLLGGNNTTYGSYAYADLPISVGPLPFSESIEYEFLIIDKSSSVCFNFYDVGKVKSCAEVPCDIDDVSISFPEDCTPNGIIYGVLEFDYSGNVSDSFTVKGNGNHYGTFAYGADSYEIGPIPGDCKSFLEFEVRDNSDDGCSDYVELEEPICCPGSCSITDLRIDKDVCDDVGLFYVNLLFNYEGSVSDSFYVKGNGNVYGTFAYGEESYRIGPLDGDCITIYEFIVRDVQSPDCQADASIEEPVCCGDRCGIDDVRVEAGECNEEDMFYVDVEFQTIGSVSDSFSIVGNGRNYGTFAYGETFYRVGPLEGDCETKYEFIVKDQANPDCSDFSGLEEPVCCGSGCFLEEIGLDFDCEAGNKLIIELGTSNKRQADSVIIVVNNEKVDTVGKEEFPYFYVFDEVPESVLVELIDLNDPFCIIEKDIEINCETDCEIGDLDIDFIECDESNNPFFRLDFDHNRGDNDVFKLEVDETIIGYFKYKDLPLDVGPINQAEEDYFFVVRDSIKTSCVNRKMIEPVTCSSATDEMEEFGLRMYTLPGQLLLINEDFNDVDLQIISIAGIRTFQGSVGNAVEINTSLWHPGIYIARIVINRKIFTRKVLIR
jgi:hypothetical protein